MYNHVSCKIDNSNNLETLSQDPIITSLITVLLFSFQRSSLESFYFRLPHSDLFPSTSGFWTDVSPTTQKSFIVIV